MAAVRTFKEVILFPVLVGGTILGAFALQRLYGGESVPPIVPFLGGCVVLSNLVLIPKNSFDLKTNLFGGGLTLAIAFMGVALALHGH